jgi:hypothetical protein
VGRPGLSPEIYFRLLMVGYFEGIDSERGIAWRASDSLSIRSFVRIALDARAGEFLSRADSGGGAGSFGGIELYRVWTDTELPHGRRIGTQNGRTIGYPPDGKG